MAHFKRKRTQFLRPRNKRRRTRAPMPVRLVRTRRINRIITTRAKREGIVRDKRIATLRYAMQYTVSVDATFKTTSFRANGVFDPEVAIGGHQPRGFDQFMTLYTEFIVLSSTITAKSWTRSGNEPCAVNIVTTSSIVVNDGTLVDMLENNPRTTRTGAWRADGGGSRGGFVKSGVNVKKYLNRHGTLTDDFDLRGNSAADPTESIVFHVNHTNAGNINVGITDVLVVLTYRVMFMDPVKFGVS